MQGRKRNACSLKNVLKTGFLMFSTATHAMEYVMKGCNREVVVNMDNLDHLVYEARGISTCPTGDGQLIDMCSGKKQSFLKGIPHTVIEGSKGSVLTPGKEYTIPTGEQPQYAELCEGRLIIKRQIKFSVKTPVRTGNIYPVNKGKHVELTDLATGNVIIKLKQGVDYTIEPKAVFTKSTSKPGKMR